MKRLCFLVICMSIIMGCSTSTSSTKALVDYVDPNIGTAHCRWFFYTPAAIPFGMAKLAPSTDAHLGNPGGWQAVGYDFRHTSIEGFANFHEFQVGGVVFAPTVGELQTVPGELENPDGGYRSRFDKKDEVAAPGYYSVLLKDYGVKAELTAMKRVGFHRYTYPKTELANLIFDIGNKQGESGEVKDAEVQYFEDGRVEGYVITSPVYVNIYQKGADVRMYFSAVLNKKPVQVGTFVKDVVNPGKHQEKGPGAGLYMTFSTEEQEAVEVKVGLSYTSIENARFNRETEAADVTFDQAKKNAPCIVFIDEIDAVGRQRGAGLGGGHDEREQTLNQLLVEMDGFGANEGIIMIAATNRPDILDPALLRPGRFDRQIVVDRPDIRGRLAILKVHAKGKPIDSNVDMEVLARRTPGFTGADLANLVNEGALLAARHNQMTITMSDLEEAAERVMMGPERRSRVISDNEKRLTAYHEGGHTLVGMLLDHTDPVHKVTIIPRGRAGGYTLSLPKEDRYYATRSELLDELKVLLGGRVAEALVLHEISSGASNDLQRATELARQMTCEYGMSERLGAVTFGHRQQQVFLGRDIGHENMYSEKIAAEIDGEIRRFIDEAYEGTVKLLQDNIDKLHLIAQALIERETLEEHEIKELVEYGRILEKGEVASSKEGSPMDPVKLEGETLPEGNPPSARQEGPLPKDDSQPLG